MAQIYSDPTRAEDPFLLPDVEVFYHHGPDAIDIMIESSMLKGWYWWSCFPGCLPDGDPNGPFETEAAAIADAQDI